MATIINNPTERKVDDGTSAGLMFAVLTIIFLGLGYLAYNVLVAGSREAAPAVPDIEVQVPVPGTEGESAPASE